MPKGCPGVNPPWRPPRIAAMASPEGIYHGSVRALSVVMMGIGVLILVLTLAAGGGPLSLGILLGLAFIAVGVGRLWMASRMKR
jgi:hypothetical protein